MSRTRKKIDCCSHPDCSDNHFNRMAVIRSSTPAPAEPAPKSELKRIMQLEVPVIVKLAERKLALSEVLRLGVGSIIEFVKSNDEPLQLMINNQTIAIGEAVKVGENFGLRIKQVGTVKQLVAALGNGLR
jgi:flagellar motor switch protein FliN/FliY